MIHSNIQEKISFWKVIFSLSIVMVIAGLGRLATVINYMEKVHPFAILFLLSVCYFGNIFCRYLFTNVIDLIRYNYWRVALLLCLFTIAFYGLLWIIAWKGHPGFYYDDELGYHLYAKMQAKEFEFRDFLDIGNKGNGFHFYMSMLYFLFGPMPLLIRLTNAMFGLWLAYAIASISMYIFPDRPKIAKRSFWFIVINPLMLVWVWSQLRDIQIAFYVSLLVWSFVCILVDSKYKIYIIFLTTIIGILGLYLLRPASLFITLVAILLGIIISLIVERKLIRVKFIFFLLLMLILPILTQSLWMNRIGSYQKQYFAENAIERFTTDVERRDNFNDQLFTIKFWSPVNLISAFVLYMLSPSPFWLFGSPGIYSIHEFLPGLVWYILMPYCVLGIYRMIFKQSENKGIKIFLGLFIFFFMIETLISRFSFSGDFIKYRVPLMPLFMISASYIIETRDEYKNSANIFSIFVYFTLLLGGIIYLSSKF